MRHGHAGVIDHIDCISGQHPRRRAGLERHQAQPHRVCDNRPAGLSLPPVIDHRYLQLLLSPFERFRVQALAGKKQSPQSQQIMVFDQFALGIVATDRSKCRRCGEKDFDIMLSNDAPECSGIRCANRLSFENDTRIAVQKRCVDDVGMTDDPADIRCCPEHLTG
ncbi:hypothetical protein D3C87_1414140 [compost metagenome]